MPSSTASRVETSPRGAIRGHHLEHINGDPDAIEVCKASTSDSVTMPKDLFERMYLQPPVAHTRGTLQKTFGNPTPLLVYPRLRCGLLVDSILVDRAGR